MRLTAALALLCLTLFPGALAAQIPPDARWRTIETEHFRVNYVEGLEPLARRAADRAERAYRLLAEELPETPRGRIDLVLADNVDFANGSATPLPTNRVVLYAHAPVGERNLAFYDDWMQLLVLHELVHIFHLDAAGGVWDRLRAVFGRNPLLFPSFSSPPWLIEGLATYYESRLTEGGRLRGTAFEMALRAAVLEDRFFPIDRATSGSVRWPAGNTRYLYGATFVGYLARTHGADRVPDLLERYARQVVPFRSDAAARGAFGTSLTRAWERWTDSLEHRYAVLADSLRAVGLTEPEVLTTHGRIASFPRYSPDGAAISYAAATGLDEPATRLILADGSVRTVAERTSLGPSPWLPGGGGVLFAQLDFVDPYRIYSDLYRAPVGGDEQRLTRGARVWDPDVHPDGARAVVVTNREASNVLAVLDLRTGEARPITRPDPDVHWAWPRWSPGGERIAVTRWSRGGLYDVVLLDSAGTVLRELTRDRALESAPAWSPDGRYVLFASDRTGISNLYAYDLVESALHQVTNVLTGAFEPDVSPDGRWIAFSYYLADGYHIARIPFAPGAWRPAPPPRGEVAGSIDASGLEAVAGGPARPYSPWPTVRPAAWSLLLDSGTELGVGGGAALFGEDAIQRHLWSTELLVYPESGRVDAGAAYRYRGWGNPVLDLVLSQQWSVAQAADEEQGTPATLRREREAYAALQLVRRRWRSTSWLSLGGEISDRALSFAAPTERRYAAIPLDVAAIATAGYSSARGFGISLGPQQGVRLSASLEGHRYTSAPAGADAPTGYLRLTGRSAAFHALPLPGFARHVLAARLSAGLETGPRSPGFGAGGASGAGAAGIPLELGALGEGLSFPVRGYPSAAQVGNRALSATAEYRFPLLLVERGVRLLPIALDRIWGDLFADAGAAWCPGVCERPFRQPTLELRPLASVGAELVIDLRLGYLADLPLRFGAALPLRDPGAGEPSVYVRVGRSF